MTSQTITIRGTAQDCWIIDRCSSDEAQAGWPALETDWFDEMEGRWIVAYNEAAHCPTVPYQFALRCPPIFC
jgi:hypothetical protein